jgi:hypothetical protein
MFESPIIESKEKKKKCPEFVYLNLPSRYVSVVLTAPDKFVDLHTVAEIEPKQEVLSVKMKNNDVWGVYPILSNVEMISEIEFFVSDDVYEMLKGLPVEKVNSLSRADFLELLYSLVDESGHSLLEENFNRLFSREGDVYVNDYDSKMEIQGIYYKGKYIPFDEIEKFKAGIEQDFQMFEHLSGVERGDFLYRAVDDVEWQSILKNGYYFIRDNTNFEDMIGPQVKGYAKKSDYSGQIIRIKVQGSYYKKAGLQVKRITSIAPHFSKVEVLDGDDWISVEAYQKKQNV